VAFFTQNTVIATSQELSHPFDGRPLRGYSGRLGLAARWVPPKHGRQKVCYLGSFSVSSLVQGREFEREGNLV